MSRTIVAMCVSCVLGGGALAQESRFAADAELLVGAFSDIHPGYARYTSEDELRLAADELRAAAQGDLSEGEFYLAVQKYLAAIRCEHTEAELPGGLRDRLAASMLPVDFEYVSDAAGAYRAIVMSSAVESVDAGDELLAVNGRTMGEAFAAMAPFISVDGFTDHTKTTLFAGTDDIGLTTFDIFFPLIFGESDGFTLLVETPGDEPREVLAQGIDEASSLAMRSVPGQKNFSDDGAVQWSMANETTAMLWVNTFVNYRTAVDPEAVFGPVFEAINAGGADRLIVDLRDVGGGSGDVKQSLMRHLITRPIRVGGPTFVRTYEFDAYREHLGTWVQGAFDIPASMFKPDENGLWRVKPPVGGQQETIGPAAHAWAGELVILCGPHNESGATWLLAELREQRELTLVGEPTGGSAEGPTAGVMAFLTLPHPGIVARLPLLLQRTSATDFERGMGIAPEVAAPVTVESLRAGRDPAMEAALALE